MNAPVVLFVYNRINKTQKTIVALKENQLAQESDLFIYSDGPKSEVDIPHVRELRDFLKSISGFKSVTIIESEKNLGLEQSIVAGITKIIDKCGKVIVLEDDIVTSKYFLQYMNDSLSLYQNEDKVMSISGYMYPHKNKLPDTFFYNVPLCWGWSTWKRAWDKYNDSSDFHIDYLTKNKLWSDFNKVGGKYLERQLRNNKKGIINTWFIYWHASVFYENGFCLFPNTSLVDNIGFDNTGEHSNRTNKFYSPIAQNPVIVIKQKLIENQEARKIIKHFYLFKRNSYVKKAKEFFFTFSSKFIRV